MTTDELRPMAVLLGTMARLAQGLYGAPRDATLHLTGQRPEWWVVPRDAGGLIEVAIVGELADEETLAFALSADCEAGVAVLQASIEITTRYGGDTLWEHPMPAAHTLADFERAAEAAADELLQVLGRFAAASPTVPAGAADAERIVKAITGSPDRP